MKISRLKAGRILIVLIASVILNSAKADAPGLPPATIRVKSSDGRISVVSIPGRNTIAYSVDGKRLWIVPGWHEQFLVPNNGIDLIVLYGGLNLIPKNYSENLVLMTVWRRGRIFRRFRLREIVAEPSTLTETASHYFWGNVLTLRNNKDIIINRSDGKQISLNYENGRIEIVGNWMPIDAGARFQ